MDIAANYYSWLNNMTYTKQLGSNIKKISLPFLDRVNDYVEIYVIENSNNHFTFTDDGETIRELISSGFRINERRDKMISGIAASCGVNINSENAITVNADASDFQLKIHMLLQCIMRVSDLCLINESEPRARLNDDITAFLTTNKIKFQTNYKLIGKSRIPCIFDYVIRKGDDVPKKYIKAINDLDNNAAKLLSFNWEDTKASRAGNDFLLAIIGSTVNNERKAAYDCFDAYGITAVEWSKRDEVLDKLAS